MTKILFDLDGTITKQETLPIIAHAFSMQNNILSLTQDTVSGKIPFVESFIRRVHMLKDLPVNEINKLLTTVNLYSDIVSFISEHKDKCAIVTGNLDCWCFDLLSKIDCPYFCSTATVANNKISKLDKILIKEEVVTYYKNKNHRVIYIGDGNNDVEAMRLADVSIASWLTHQPSLGVIMTSDYLVTSEVSLCRLLNQLL